MMNYNISGIDMMILEQLAMFDTARVEIKKEHQVLMVNKSTSFKKKGKGKKKGNFKKNGKQVAAQEKKPKSRPKLVSAFWERGSPDLPACGPRHG
ncbi:hypothetical protein U6Y93_12345 [Cutibacterium acnes]